LYESDAPAYIRVGRDAMPDVYGNTYQGRAFVFGKANMLRSGFDVTIIACGEFVAPAIVASDALRAEGLSVRVLDMATIKPLDSDAILQAAEETGALLTCEEHSVYGGLGAAVAEVTSQVNPVPLKIMGLPDSYLKTGTSQEVKRYYHLDAEGMENEARALVKRKRR